MPPGDPATVRDLADVLAGQGEVVGALARTLRGLCDPDVVSWEGAAAVAFRARSAAVASLLERIARRYAVSAVALRPLAAALAQARAQCEWGSREQEDAMAQALRWGDQMSEAQASPDPAVRSTASVHQRQMVAELERAQGAERSHADAWEQWRAADRRCAAVLHGLEDDGLKDSRTYDVLTGASRAGGGIAQASGVVALLPHPAAGPFRAAEVVASGTQLGADLTVKVAYGDGDLTDIVLRAAASAAGPVAGVLKQGARHTNATVLAATTRAARREATPSTPERLRAALLEQRRRLTTGSATTRFGKAPTAGTHTVRWTGPPRGLGAAGLRAKRQWAGEQASARMRAYAQKAWLDDLALVTRTPGGSRGMLLTSFGAEAAGSALGGVGTGREAWQAHREGREREHWEARHRP